MLIFNVLVGPESLIFDCGEGSIRQSVLAKSFFDLNIRFVVSIFGFFTSIYAYFWSRIFITHMHLDHCIGLPGIITSLAKPGDTRPIHIYGPSGLLLPLIFFFSEITMYVL